MSGPLQAAVHAWVEQHNTSRPHQGLDPKAPVTPTDGFIPIPDQERALVDLWLTYTFLTGSRSVGRRARRSRTNAGVGVEAVDTDRVAAVHYGGATRQ